MSHNYPYRGPPAKDSRPGLGTCSASNHLHSEDYNFYRQSQESSSHLSSSNSYPSSSSSRASMGTSYSSQRSDGSTLSLLSSCGLEPKDLSLLAELPEEVLTLESLPHLLTQIKGKRGTIKPYPPTPPSSSSSRPTSSSRLPAATASSEWERIRTQPVQYPLDHSYLTPKPLPPEQVQDWQDRWGNPRQTGTASSKTSSSAEPSSSSSSTAYIVDYDHRDKPTDYGKKGRDNSYSSRLDRPYSSPAVGNGSRKPPQLSSQSGDADYRFAPPEDYKPKARADRRERDASYNTSRLSTAQKIPPRKAALDFHGTSPVAYPYSCTLCDITVLSEKFWVQHINGSQHADGQLTLLQQFPDWDCRMETIRKSAGDQAEKPKDEGRTTQCPQTTNQSSFRHPNKRTQKKSTANSKVVCAKFAAQSVDENYLRTLTDPFGKIVKVLMFPALVCSLPGDIIWQCFSGGRCGGALETQNTAFVEMGSVDQAKDLVKYYSSNPTKAKGEEITFYVSPTLNFLQSSRVVSFTPAPAAEDGHVDLITIVKRFGPPLYTLFLPSLAFVEMKNAPDAQKLVEYYSSNTLRIDDETIKVAFSGEYNTLMRVSSAKKYEEESSGTKRSRSPSPKRRDSSSHSKRRRRSREQEGERKRGREKSSHERRNRSRSSDRSSRSRCSHSRDGRSKEKASVPDKTQPSESKADKPAPSSSSQPETKRETSDNEGQTKTPPSSTEEPVAPTEEAGETCRLSGEESDIEGMEVIGEDGENLEDEDMETLDGTDGEEGEKEGESEEEEGRMMTEEEAVKEGEPVETTTALEKGEEEEAAEQEKQEEDTQMREEVKDKKDVGEEEVPTLDETSGIAAEEASPAVEASASGSEPQPDRDTQQITVTPKEEDEEEPDFPVDLENCITLDELVEESDDQDGESKDETESSPGSVIYFRNLPARYYTDADFVRLVKDFGEVTRYFLIRNRSEGFIEMASSSEAVIAVKELRRKTVEFRGSVLTAQLSRKYRSLTGGWKWQPEDEKRERRSRGSRTSERISTRSQSKSKTTEEEEDSNKKSVEREELTKEPNKRKDLAKKTPEKEASAKKSAIVEEKPKEKVVGSEEVSSKPGSEEQEESEVVADEPSHVTEDPQKADARKDCTSGDVIKDDVEERQTCSTAEVELQADPVETAEELVKPTKPVGAEFVRPVVGYFCNLCKVIYADEDEAKNEHCSTISHYQKYKEHTGRDPWAS